MPPEPTRPSPKGTRVLWVDATAGVAGDMLLGAMLDAGVPLEVVVGAVEAVMPKTVEITSTSVVRAGLRATKVDVALRAHRDGSIEGHGFDVASRDVAHEQGHGHAHEHGHGHDPGHAHHGTEYEDDESRSEHRGWAEIRERLTAAELPDAVRARAITAFSALAEVEARAHGVAVEDVHFHEVGAWDSISDVVGVCAAIEHLGVDEVVVSRIALGSGTVRAAHGELPVPVPAVLGLAAGWEVAAVGEGELATPTGMALVTTLAGSQGPLPTLRVESTGVGAGTKDVAGRANVVRVVVGTRPEADQDDLRGEALVVLEANIDDLDPRVWPGVLDELLSAGASDAWLTPILMKRGRPAHTLSVLTHPENADALRDLILEQTSSIGVREVPVRRWALARSWVSVSASGQEVRVKVAHRAGRIVHATPEFRDVEAAAAAAGRPVREVLEAAVGAAVAARLVPGAEVPFPVE
jgi:uncharacterized protein (TIGR00299 family) protein